MARPLRIEFEGAWYHVMNRGTGRRLIFHDTFDRRKFLNLLREIYETWNIEIHAYCLMNNHYHLLVHTPNGKLSFGIKYLDQVYAQFYNRKYRRDGPLFRGRFKSILVERDGYLLELVRYIHNNPVEANLSKTPDAYPWSSHKWYLRFKKRPAFLMIDDTLREFSKKYSIAVKRFDDFVKSGTSKRLKEYLNGKKHPSVLGSRGFIEWVKYNYIDKIKSKQEIPEIRRFKRKKVPLQMILRHLQSEYNVSKAKIISANHRQKNEARSMAVYLMRHLNGMSFNEIASFLGGITDRSASKIMERLKKQFKDDDGLKTKARAYERYLLSLVEM